MTNTNETIADIIAAMRDDGHTGESSCLEWIGTKMRHYADRLDAVLGEVARHGKPQQATLPLGETFTGGKA
jgi:hypothetical protein